MGTYLDDIVEWHRTRSLGDHRSWRERMESVRYTGSSMREALDAKASSSVKVIAEVKRRSPSKGWIDEHLDPAGLAQEYVRGGASAISVLTDAPHFSGSTEDLAAVRASVAVPILRKDFTVSENDVIDTAAMGASTVLLIVAALSVEELSSFLAIARHCGIDALVEVHDSEEARIAIDLGASIIGVNQRDLKTFEVDSRRAAGVISALPSSIIAIAESGLRAPLDVEAAAEAGFDAVLVGEAFVRASDIESCVRSFSTIPRVARA